jgi:hypothetical protein
MNNFRFIVKTDRVNTENVYMKSGASLNASYSDERTKKVVNRYGMGLARGDRNLPFE